MAAERLLCQWSGFYGQHFQENRGIALRKDGGALELFRSCYWKYLLSKSNIDSTKLCFAAMPSFVKSNVLKKKGIQVLSPNTVSPSTPLELLEAWDDEYSGIVIDSASLPSSANAFASALRSSSIFLDELEIEVADMSTMQGKRGIWLKLFEEQSDLVPIAIQEGFSYLHAEPGYVMHTYWIPDEPCLLPTSPSHQIGIAGFVINDNRKILVVKEKSSCSCSGVWKLPTGYINKSEELFSGAIREVKEETGVDTIFLEMFAFRHAHLVAFEKSDLLFVCMLKPLSLEIVVDGNEIQDAKWITLDELLGQQSYEDDQMSRKIIEICMDNYESRYSGFTAQRVVSKFDGKLSSLYYKNGNMI